MNNIIYFDNFATTSLNEEIFNEMKEFLVYNYSNPSSIYEFAQKSRVAIEKSRENIANYINAEKNELFLHQVELKRIIGQFLVLQCLKVKKVVI
ncbi:aminotransferase, class V domain protein [Parvimonas sp. oral taxon 393 str. F0440]|nr:aminotransferase, class V domain protein [Parvimonas sp. oral taxon 393 str. F0440]